MKVENNLLVQNVNICDLAENVGWKCVEELGWICLNFLPYNVKHKTLTVIVYSAENLLPMKTNGLSNPFVKVTQFRHHSKKTNKTKTCRSTLNPIWGECLTFSNIEDSELLFQVKSSRFGLQRLIKREKLHGDVYLKTSEIPVQGIEGCFKLLKKIQ